ncbi:acidic fibroblast growth factor intracellular-binding protein-like isoform X2 [Pollicipes pollicipes]|uniref:acidic fibroblast growth factor intracellular-binding protein-like isoform X2 n=1 Tax=Pollicipes pollicipes TaxID=41117 RepID=UPI001884D95E|nr:acidic fibroblast growth factor intracellular-binding protein-like isoform X2 [Pollicipes pollicipes]
MFLPELDIFVGNVFIIDWEIFKLWLDGHSGHSAVSLLQQRGTLLAGATLDMLHGDVMDHYRSFSTLERLLEVPTLFVEQRVLQISPNDQMDIIEKYYDFDDAVMRELIGKKPSSKLRKELDDVCDKTGVLVRSCRRQFDNVRRIYKQVDEMTGNVLDNIRQQFLLPDPLARRYAAILFLDWVRFETHKRKLAHLTFNDFFVCADALLRHWADEECELDKEFFQDLREIKAMLDREKEAKAVTLRKLEGGRLSTDAAGDLSQNFRCLFRSLVNIATGLYRSRELKDLFIDLQEKVVEPCKSARWTLQDMDAFLAAINFDVSEIDTFRRETDLPILWRRYLRAVGPCVLQLFAS